MIESILREAGEEEYNVCDTETENEERDINSHGCNIPKPGSFH